MTASTDVRRNVDAVLAERARLLARPAVAASTVAMSELVSFSAGGERYAVETAFVHRLERSARVTPLPAAPRHFAGITNLHGQLVTLVDLGVLLGAPACPEPAFVIVLGTARAEIGIVADALLDMIALPQTALHTPGAAARTLVRHITSDGIAVIDAAATIADPRLICGEPAPISHEETPR
jgi:purine-binding chemotaxis protein CheW